MFNRLCIFFALIAGLAVVPNALAQETFTHDETGFSFTLPAGWTFVQEGDFFEADSPDEAVSLLFFVGHGKEIDAVIDGAMEELGTIIRDPKITTDHTESNVNGLLQVYAEGDGLIDGEPVDWDLTCVVGKTKSMVIIGLGDIASRQGVMDRIYQSIRK